VNSFVPVLLFAVAGMLVGGAWSLHKQGAARGAVGLVAVLAVLAIAGGIVWLIPGDG
jgi:high-affinity Fe2+/Pb2+ permease